MDYLNPILRGFHADPSICKADDSYYLVNSSFEYFPGIPVFQSRDLVNWTQIGNAISWENPVLLEGMQESGGIWAPTIRYHEGIFFITAAIENYGNFIVHAKDPTKNWSEPVWVDIGGIDPSLFFEEEKAYYCTTDKLGSQNDGICLGEIDPFTGKIYREFVTVWKGTGGGWLESPHLYHIGAWYYILTAEGGTFTTHMVTIGRSAQLYGPYEAYDKNPILTNREDTSLTVLGTGHGDIIQDEEGCWWMVHLGTRLARRTMSHLGRETFLTPFCWENDWPVFRDKKARIEELGVIKAPQINTYKFEDRFDSAGWDLPWHFLRNPVMTNYERGHGKLCLIPSPCKLEENNNTTMTLVCVTQPDFTCSMEAALVFLPEEEQDEAGVLIYHTHRFFYAFGIRKKDGRCSVFVEKHVDDMKETVFDTPLIKNEILMRVAADRDKYTFFLETKEGLVAVAEASTRFLANEVVGRSFTGTMLGLYADSREKTGAVACFRYFTVWTE